MSIIKTLVSFAIPNGYPCPVTNLRDAYVNSNGCIFRGYEFKDRSIVNYKGIILYFHGSGTGEPKPDILSDTLNAAGYIFVSINELNWGISGASPHRYGYGNINDPEFTQRWIMSAWWIRSVIDHYQARINLESIPVVLLGHSMGAAAVLGYLADYANGEHVSTIGSNYKGCIVNGATIAGLGNYSWNDINYNINQMSQMMRLAQDAPKPKIIVYADKDRYVPPDYVSYLKTVVDPEDADTYFISAGDRPHVWFNKDIKSAELVLSWVDQLIFSKKIK